MFGKKKNENKKQGFLDRLLYGPTSVSKITKKPIAVIQSSPVTQKPRPQEAKKIEKLEKVLPITKNIVPATQKTLPVKEFKAPVQEKPVEKIVQREIKIPVIERKEDEVVSKIVIPVNTEKESVYLIPPLPPKVRVIPRDKYFNLGSNRSLGNILELRDALKTLPSDKWNYYVSGQKNQFANWVEDTFYEYELANKLRATIDKDRSVAILTSYLTRS